MVVTTELSLYPLTKDYEGPIIAFIKKLKESTDIEVYTHSMSTYVKGESQVVFTAVEAALASCDGTVSLVMKTINRDLPVEGGFLEF
jgi:uncharacterized protein YqgV (UPF0045/DUF77 family)